MKANPYSSAAEQARELGLTVGDTIQGREEVGESWHEARITLLWLGTTHTAWIVSGSSSRPREGGAWSGPHEATNWDLACREWERIETPPEHAALLPAPDPAATRAATVAEVRAADAAISDEALAAEYRAWWGASYGVPPNNQAVAVAVAWGRHLLAKLAADCQAGTAVATNASTDLSLPAWLPVTPGAFYPGRTGGTK